jgi:hypothetical protein
MLCSCMDVKYCCCWVYWIDGCPNSSILSCDLILFFYAYSENAGLVGLTRVGSRRVIQISAGFMLLFSVLGVVFHIALFYFLFSHYFFTEIIEFRLSLQSMLLDSLFILSWLSTTVLLKRLLFFSPVIWSLDQFANRNLAPSLYCSHSNCSYGVAIHLLQENLGLFLLLYHCQLWQLFTVSSSPMWVGITFLLFWGWILNYQSILPRGKMMLTATVCLILEEAWQWWRLEHLRPLKVNILCT